MPQLIMGVLLFYRQMMHGLLGFFRRDHYRLFLLDGLGALLSAALLGGVLAPRASTFGMSSATLLMLAAIALVFSGYSLGCYGIRPARWRGFLRLIATANVIYCVGTIVAVSYYRGQLTGWGAGYFAAECTVILVLAGIEFRCCRQLNR